MRRRLVLRVKNTQNRAAQRPREKGPLARGRECANPSRSHRSLLPSSGPSSSSSPPLSLGDLCCYIFLSSVHPPSTLVSHPCLSSSARPISHSLWRSVSCCGPHRFVQGSHPHQWGQSVSCGYLIRRWLLLLGLSLHHSPMASLYGLESFFAILEWISLGDVALFSPMILAYRGEGRPWQYHLVVWIPFIRPQTLLPPRCRPWAWYQMGWSPQILWPHNSSSKSCCPNPRTERRILMFSGLHHGRLSFVSLWAPGLLCLPMTRSWRFGIRGALSWILSFLG